MVDRVPLADAPNGGWVARVTQNSGTYYTLDDGPDTVPSATAGATYTATAYVKAASPSAVGKPVRIVIRERTAAGGFVQETSSTAVTLTNAFQPVTVTGTAQTTGDVVDLYIQQDNAVAGDSFYVDLASLVPVTAGGGGGTTPIPTGNLTANPSMETNAAGWGAWQSTLARTAVADAPNGNFAMQVSQTSGTFYTIDDTPDTVPSATAGTNYTGTAYVKAATASAVGKPVRIVVRERTAAGGLRGRDHLGGGHPDQRLPAHHGDPHRADDGRRHRPLHPAGHGGGGQRLLRRPDLPRAGRRRRRRGRRAPPRCRPAT